MSEHQYYEFQTLDRRLSKEEMEELRELSTRAEITPTSFVNVYNYGDFRGNPGKLIIRYFDAFVYLSNWGSYRLMLRIPKGLIDEATLGAYRDEESFDVITGDDCLVLDFHLRLEDGGEWRNDARWMPELIPLRDEIMRGDLRPLYLGWLASLFVYPGCEENLRDKTVKEPPVPPGLGHLTKAQRSLAEFLMIDEALIRAAAEASAEGASEGAARAEKTKWVEKLPEAEKNAWLLRLLDAEDDESSVRTALRVRFREATASHGASIANNQERRAVIELLKSAQTIQLEIDHEVAEKRVREEARQAREKEERRDKRRKELTGREPQAWDEVDRLIGAKKTDEYDQAVSLLKDLLDLADSTGRRDEAIERIRDLRARHTTKQAFVRRLNKAFDLKRASGRS